MSVGVKMSETLIIAEAGVNHNGDISLAKELIDAASEAGADIVKFQTFKASKLVTNDAPMAAYQLKNTGKEQTQKQLLEQLEISYEAHFELQEYSNKKSIEFLSTPFDIGSADFLINELKLQRIKIGSGLVNHAPYMHFIAQTKIPVIISTGMCDLVEVEQALAVLARGYSLDKENLAYSTFKKPLSKEDLEILKEKVTVLHCVTNYPCEYSEVNLKAMNTIGDKFGLDVGYSDHSLGVEIPCAAVAMGAKVIEKHFTLDKNLPGPDHKASLDVPELKDMVRKIRNIEQALGTGEKAPTDSEKKNIPIVRMSMVAAEDIAIGESLSESNIAIRRPGSGLSPMYYWDILGSKAERAYKKGENITKEGL